jgi:single-stranded DNA-binding protein
MSGNAIVTIHGNCGREPEVRKLGQSEYYCFSMAVHDSRGTDKAPTWFGVNIFKDHRSEKVIPSVRKGSYLRVTGTLKVREVSGKNYLDVYCPLEMFAFMGDHQTKNGNPNNPPQNPKGDDADAPVEAAAADDNDIPF